MANFKTHVSVSSSLGVAYAGVGILCGVPIDCALLAGGLCGVSGMLPDLDSDSGIPLRETMGFAAAVVPMLLINRFQQFNVSHEMMVLIGVAIYGVIRFSMTRLISRWTVHRGMFHSIPAAFIFAGLAFLVCGGHEIHTRYFKAGAVLLGFMSHLLLDELYSVEWQGGRWRLKKSSGTAFKLWGKDAWANFSTYSKLAIVAVLIFSEPSVMALIETRAPGLFQRTQQVRSQINHVKDKARQTAGNIFYHQQSDRNRRFQESHLQKPDQPQGRLLSPSQQQYANQQQRISSPATRRNYVPTEAAASRHTLRPANQQQLRTAQNQ